MTTQSRTVSAADFSNILALVFDFDGTLVTGTNEAYVRCYYKAAAAAGCRLDLEVVRARVLERWGASPRVELGSVLRERLSLVDVATAHYERLIRTQSFARHVNAVPEAEITLSAIRRMGIKTVVVSGMPLDLLRGFSKRFGFGFAPSDLISTVETDDPEKQKHTGHHLNLLLRKRRWDSGSVAVVGDAASDISMAVRAGTRSIAVLTGWFTAQTAKTAGAELVLPSIRELPRLLCETGRKK